MDKNKQEKQNLKEPAKPGEESGINIKYPFSGKAPNLIDKFLIIGYDPKTIEYTFENGGCDPPSELNTRFNFYDFEERPFIINEICNDYAKDLLDNDLIIELIFPNFPQMYFLNKQDAYTKKEPDEELLISNYSIIFSINPQDNSGSKKSYNGLGYVFYIPQERRTEGEIDGIIYVPIAYVILSEFPYFYHFNEICKNILFQVKKESDEIPIEILLYNAVKYIPSPIKWCLNLSFGAQIGYKQEKNSKIEYIMENLNSNIQKETGGIPTMFFNQLSGYPFLDVNASFIFNLIPSEIIVEVFIFSFLEHDIIFYSSRPEILNMVMYLFSCFNYPFNDSIYYWHVLSVSQESFMSGASTFVGKTCSTLTGILNEYDPEILTTKKIREHFVLDIDNKNFFFLYQEETEEVKQTMDLYTYIKNCAADAEDSPSDIKNSEFDIKTKELFNDGIQLYDSIKNLMEELQRRSKKVTATNYNERPVKPTFLTMYEDESEMECMKANLRLQKAFLSFITQILQNFLKILSIGGGEEKENKDISLSINIMKDENLDQEEVNKRQLASKAGRIFKEKFKDSSKYSSFVYNFCKFHETVDLYKIPYTFINEFVYYSHVGVKNNLSEVDVFKLIDQFYGKRKIDDFDEIIAQKEKNKEKQKEKQKEEKKKKKETIIDDELVIISESYLKSFNTLETDLENIYLFSFDDFADYFKHNLRALINREQEDDKIFVKIKGATGKSTNFKRYKRIGYYLSTKLLNVYINYSNNHFEDLMKTFTLVKCEYEKDKDNQPKPQKTQVLDITNLEYYKIIKDKSYRKKRAVGEIELKLFGNFEMNEITDVIQHHLITERCFSSYGLIKFSLLNVFAITRTIKGTKIKNREVISTMCDFCEQTRSLVRKYMNLYLKIFINLKEKIGKDAQADIEDCLNIITSYFQKTNMIPTEETTKTIKDLKDTKEETEKKMDEKSIKTDGAEFIKLVQEKGTFFEIKEGGGGGLFKKKNNNTRQKFEELLKIIETIFDGSFTNYKTSTFNFEYKDLAKMAEGFTPKGEKFLPKTPLSLYSNTTKMLLKYIKDFSLDKNMYKDLCINILSLMFYFKIKIIDRKWIEIKNFDRTFNPNKLYKKGKDSSGVESKINESYSISNTVKKIITILYDLFENVKKIK